MREITTMEIVDDDAPEFFAPVSHNVIDSLLAQYQSMRDLIDEAVGVFNGRMSHVMRYFFDGNKDPDSGRGDRTVERVFRKEGAIKSLNADYWSRALALTDVLDCMPQKRRDFWNAQIAGMNHVGRGSSAENVPPLPDFEEATVRATLKDLLAMRATFFAERVDGIFQSLSREHVTNCPQGFSKRMILGGVYSYYADASQVGVINDLRCVLAKFMGRDEPKWNATSGVADIARKRHGEWLTVDGGAMRIRIYLKGTAHLEIHPNMAYRLNQVLAHLHPLAIPAEFRTKQKKASKEFQMMGRPLPFAVTALLSDMRCARERLQPNWPEMYANISNTLRFAYGDKEKIVLAEAESVLCMIGGVKTADGYFQFDYDPTEIIDSIVASGCIPDQKSHQFYPTPEIVGAVAIEMADIGENDTCLEPSAGQGDLAALMPKSRTTCVEISPLHCTILKARGFNVVEADFIRWADVAPKFDRVICNPPYSEGRWLAHITSAYSLVKPGGRLVAVLPASARNKTFFESGKTTWSQVFENQFSGTSIAVAIMMIEREK